MTPVELQTFTKHLPRKPGVYVFRNSKGTALYVGKATNLQTRVRSYAKTNHPRLVEMVHQATKVTHEVTSNDIEALIVEAQKIKLLKPFFNVALRDDKQYTYVQFGNEVFPRITIIHRPEAGVDALGPFTESGTLKISLRLLRNLFPYCTCKQTHHVRCLNAHIGKCLGFCCLKNSQPTAEDKRRYRRNIKAIREILAGKKQSLLNKLTHQMDLAAQRGQLEKAIALRDQIARLERVFVNAQVIASTTNHTALAELATLCNLTNSPQRIEGYDIANIQGQHATGSMVVFTDGTSDKNNYRKFRIRGEQTADDPRMLAEVLTRRFQHSDWSHPDLILLDGGKAQLNAALTALAQFAYPTNQVIALTKNDKHQGDHLLRKTGSTFHAIPLAELPTAARNLILNIDAEAHRFAIAYYRALHRQSL